VQADFVPRPAAPALAHARIERTVQSMDNHQRRSSVRRASAFLDAIERRDTNRGAGTGEILLFWHHDPSRIAAYEAIDTSGTGARLRTDAPLPEGMTGVAVGFRPGDVSIERTVMVVWSRAIRDGEGHVTHHEAGIRYL
jgi:hypothetical protein